MNREKDKRKLVNVIDLEACCWMGNPPKGQAKEIIEIGIACVDYFTKEIVEKRSILVKPRRSKISEFCTSLTHITQEMVDEEGVDFKVACKILKTEFKSNKRIFISWGNYDRIAFEQECKIKRIVYPFGKTHINLEEWFGFKYGIKQAMSVANALKKIGLKFEGTQHRGVIDSINTARILQKII